MSLGLLFLILIGIIIIALGVNEPLREQLLIKFRGRIDELMNKDASTVEGAKDYYNNAIREKENTYIKANQLYIQITGKIQGFEEDIYKKQKELFKINQEINNCIDNGLEDEATRLVLKSETLKEQIETLKESIEDLKKAKEQQKEYRDLAQQSVQDMKQEKEKVVQELELNKQIIEIHKSMDENNISTESDRMLERVRNNAKKTRELAKGSQLAYDSSMTALDRKIDKVNKEQTAKQIIEKLKRERGK